MKRAVKKYQYKEEAPQCCGKVLPAPVDSGSSRMVWMCCKCGEVLGHVKRHADVTPEDILKNKSASRIMCGVME